MKFQRYQRRNLMVNQLVSVNFPSLFLESVSNGSQKFSAGPSEFLPDLHFLCKIVLKPSNVVPLLLF